MKIFKKGRDERKLPKMNLDGGMDRVLDNWPVNVNVRLRDLLRNIVELLLDATQQFCVLRCLDYFVNHRDLNSLSKNQRN